MKEPSSENNTPESVDELKITLIPALPEGRKTKVHLPRDVEELFGDKLKEYPIPDNIQVDAEKHDQHIDFNPWMLKENYKSRFGE